MFIFEKFRKGDKISLSILYTPYRVYIYIYLYIYINRFSFKRGIIAAVYKVITIMKKNQEKDRQQKALENEKVSLYVEDLKERAKTNQRDHDMYVLYVLNIL